MILYNITFNVEDDIKSEWLDFMKKEFIPNMTSSGILTNPLLSELLLKEPQGTSYALQFRVKDLDSLRKFQAEEWHPVFRILHDKFGDKVVFFPTEMKIID